MEEKENKIEELRKFISLRNGFHFNQIQLILQKKEEGKIDINLDILYKIHSNAHSEGIAIYKKLNELFPKPNERK